MTTRIGFDIDGPLAQFIPAYQKLTITIAGGLNLFRPGDDVNPPCWNWPEYRGYSPVVMAQVWKEIINSRSFWYSLTPSEHCDTLDMCIQSLEHECDVYFITARPGQSAKRQTEAWLKKHLTYPFGDVAPTVLISSDKGASAKALNLDFYIDDNFDNATAVGTQVPTCRTYLLDTNYNRLGNGPFTRVPSIGPMLDDIFKVVY